MPPEASPLPIPQKMAPPAATATAEPPEKPRPVVVKARNLEKTYDPGTPRETKALRGVNLDITASEIVVIFGTSGSGKSTLLNILAGLDNPTKGTVEMDGKDLTKMNANQLAMYHQHTLGMVFQAYNLVDTFTVEQNISMPARLAGVPRADYAVRAATLLKQFHLEKLANKLPSECSGGQQQRVGIMRAFINRPAFIIADEPTGNLDSVESQRIMRLFKTLNQETNATMLIVTHDPAMFSIADRVVHVLDGKITKQSILTKKAIVDEATIDVPVEYRYRSEDVAALINTFGGAKTEAGLGAGGAAAAAAQAAGAAGEAAAATAKEETKKLEQKQAELQAERQRVTQQTEEIQEKHQVLLQREKQLEAARGLFETKIQERIAQARASIEDERRRLLIETQAIAEIGLEQADREKTTRDILAQIEEQQKLIKEEEKRLAEAKETERQKRMVFEYEKDELRMAREDFARQAADSILAAQAVIAQAKERLASEVVTDSETKVSVAEREKRMKEALDRIAHQQVLIQEEEHRLEAARVQEAVQLKVLEAEKARLDKAAEELELEKAALKEARTAFDREVQMRVSLATNIIDHEREQLETERQQQEREQKQRAEVMDRRLQAARTIIEQEVTLVAEEHKALEQDRQKQEELARQLAKERLQIQEERRKLSLSQEQNKTKRLAKAASVRPVKQSQFELLLAERGLLSKVDQKVLGVLAAILSSDQRSGLKRAQVMRLIEVVGLRLYEVFGQLEMQEMMDRSFAYGGVGLYRQTAEHLAAEIEAMIQLGKLSLKDNDSE